MGDTEEITIRVACGSPQKLALTCLIVSNNLVSFSVRALPFDLTIKSHRLKVVVVVVPKLVDSLAAGMVIGTFGWIWSGSSGVDRLAWTFVPFDEINSLRIPICRHFFSRQAEHCLRVAMVTTHSPSLVHTNGFTLKTLRVKKALHD